MNGKGTCGAPAPAPSPPAGRPPWWPEDEAWPPRSATAWRRSAGHLFVRRVLLVLAALWSSLTTLLLRATIALALTSAMLAVLA